MLDSTEKVKVVFVSDYYSDELIGGAELTTDALIQSSPYDVLKFKSKDLTLTHLKQHAEYHWVFGNFSHINANLIPSIVANINYSIIEYDYKFCAYRSTDKHFAATGKKCDCSTKTQSGELIFLFYFGAKSIFCSTSAFHNKT